MIVSQPLLSRVALVVVLLACAAPASGQGVHWQADYATLRRQATRTGRPILLKFSTPRCYWCDVFENTTLRDPRILGLLNRSFVSLHVDASRDHDLARALRVRFYPTVVLAGPDGTIIAYLEGHQDVARFHAALQEVLSRVRGDAGPADDG